MIVFVRLRIPIRREEKPGYNNARIIHVPPLSADLAEFCGIMLGDGHLGSAQMSVTVNVKTDLAYTSYLQGLMERTFNFRPRVTKVKSGSTVDLYVTSAYLIRRLHSIGLYSNNKVRDQVGIPKWIFSTSEYCRRFVRGFFDTDGSIYRLKRFHAVQMSFNNLSVPLLEGTRQILVELGYHPSRISGHSIYLTRQSDINNYVQEIGFGNSKHYSRAQSFGIL